VAVMALSWLALALGTAGVRAVLSGWAGDHGHRDGRGDVGWVFVVRLSVLGELPALALLLVGAALDFDELSAPKVLPAAGLPHLALTTMQTKYEWIERDDE